MMDFYQIGAMKVFSELGHLIEEDERLSSQAPASEQNQIKITSLNSDIMQKIGYSWPWEFRNALGVQVIDLRLLGAQSRSSSSSMDL